MKAYMIDSRSFDHYDYGQEKEIFKNAGIDLEFVECMNEDDVIAKCSDADAILDVYVKVGPKAYDAMPNLKALVRYGVGFDVYDVPEATKRGIKVCNIPFYCIEEVAVHTIALILAASRNIVSFTHNIRNGSYLLEGFEGNVTMHSPRFTTVGMVGFGNIPRRTAQGLKAIGYKIMAYDPFLPQEKFDEAGATRGTLEEVLSQADIISPNVPLNPSTYHIINEDAFKMMKDGVIIANTGRGALIDEAALIANLKSGKVAAAGLDVFEGDHLPAGHPFYEMDNVILTPHAAFKTEESFLELCKQVALTAVAVLNEDYDSIMPNIVNKRDLGLIK